MVWTAFCGSRNKKEKTETDIPQPSGIKKKGGEKILAFFLRGSLFLPWTVCSFSLKLWGWRGRGTGHGLQRWTNRGDKRTSWMWYLSRIQWPWYFWRLLASYFVESLSICISLIFHQGQKPPKLYCVPSACIRRQTMLHTHTDIYKLFFILFSLIGYYKILSRAPCAIQ